MLYCDTPTRRGNHRAVKANLPRRREGKKKTHAEARRRRGKRENPATPETTEYHSISRRKSVQEHPRERLILCKASIPGFAVSASMRCTCRRSISASRARASWVNFRFCRMRQTLMCHDAGTAPTFAQSGASRRFCQKGTASPTDRRIFFLSARLKMVGTHPKMMFGKSCLSGAFNGGMPDCLGGSLSNVFVLRQIIRVSTKS